MSDSEDRTASLMTPARLAQLRERPRPAASPAAWLDQLAADAGSGHVRRLADLRRQLESQSREWDEAPVAAAIQALAAGLQQLDYALVQPRGWLARATGKGKEAASAFVAQYDRNVHAGEDLADEARALQKLQQAAGPALERSVVETEVELRAIEKIMEQGARWLQDMRGQLKTRQAQGGDEAAQQQIRDDTVRCEMLVERLKLLRAVSGATQPLVERCKALAPRRAALVKSLQRLLETEWPAWERKAGAVADEAKAGGAAQGADAAAAAQQQLQAALQQAAQECTSLQAQQRALADELAALQGPLQAAA